MSWELNISTKSMSRLIRDDQHMRMYRRSKRHILTPALKVIRRTRAERLLQWHAENGRENILFTDEKIFTIEEQYNHQNKGFMLTHPMRWRKTFWGWREATTLPTSWSGGRCPIRGVTHLHFCKKGVKLVSQCIKRTCYKEVWNSLTWPSSVVRNGSSSRTHFPPKRPKQLRSGCGATFWPSAAPRIGFWGVQTSPPGL